MISQLAIGRIEEMQREGLTPTPADIIRLNALGLKLEHADDSVDYFALPRVSYLGDVTFREPTLGHGIWIDSVLAQVNADDLATATAVKAFALSRQHTELPDAADIRKVSKEIRKFCDERLAKFTLMQILVAITYALHGTDECAREFPPPDPLDEYETDVAESVYVGRLIETASLGLGLTVRDICGMTRVQVERLRYMALRCSGMLDAKSVRSKAEMDFFRTHDEIVERLQSSTTNTSSNGRA